MGGMQMLRQYLDSVWRRKWLVLLLGVLGLAGGYGYSLTQMSTYTAQSTVWIEGDDSRAAELDPIGSADLLQPMAWVQLLRTFSVLEPVVVERQLYVSPVPKLDETAFDTFEPNEDLQPGSYRLLVGSDGEQFTFFDPAGSPVATGRLGEPFGDQLGFRWIPQPEHFPPDGEVTLRLRTLRDAARTLGQQLQTSVNEDGTFLEIAYAADDPVEAAGVLNAVTSRYVQVATELKRARLVELTTVLSEQLATAERNLREAEIGLEGFRVQTITLPSEQAMAITPGIEQTRDPAISSFFEMRLDREALRQDRDQLETILQRIESGELTVGALSAVPSVERSFELRDAITEWASKQSELQTLEQRYTDEYPPLQRVRGDVARLEEIVIPATAGRLAAQIRMEEEQTEGQLAAASGELRRIPPRAIEEARLQRQVSIAGGLFTTLKQRYEEARLAAESSIPDVRLLDAATVPYAVVQSPILMILLGGAGGIGLGAGIAILLGIIDPKLRYPEQVIGEFGLPIIGAIAYVPSNGRRSEQLVRQAAEAFREIRMSITEGAQPDQPIVLTISSPESGDGKSFVALNLAMSFAKQRIPTLLIDGDIRRGHLHRKFDLEREPGLTNLLLDEASSDEVLHATDSNWLHFISSGRRTERGPELLTGQELPELLHALKRHYAVIIIDTPPLGAGIDPYVFGVATGSLMVVLRTNQTNRAFAAAKLELLNRLPIRVAGAVINAVPKSKAYQYYSYLPGYEVEEEEFSSLETAALQGG